jgi:hypothetical protein
VVFSEAYVCFEKLRIKQGKEKSKKILKMLEMEDAYGEQGGMSRERDRSGLMWGPDDCCA